MRYIEKGKEPTALAQHRATPQSTYDGLGKQPVQQALLKDQYGLCAYCMQRISDTAMIIEHYRPQSKFPNLDLDYRNMLGVCKGGSTVQQRAENRKLHCDQSKGNEELKVLNPLDRKVTMHYDFTMDGRMNAQGVKKNQAQEDIALLNLNETFLAENRRRILKELADLYDTLPADLGQAKQILKKLKNRWEKVDKDGNMQPFCQVALDFLQHKLNRLQRKKP